MTCKYLHPKESLYGFELPNTDMLTAIQVASVLNCTQNHVYNLCATLALEAINIAPISSNFSRYRIPKEVLVSFIEERTTGPFEADFTATEVPHGLKLPDGMILRCSQVADVLRCTNQHISNLISGWSLLATDIAASENFTAYRIPRAGLIQFINSRMEGDC